MQNVLKRVLKACLLLVLAVQPIALRAQFTFTTNNGAITITRYAGPGGAVVIPGETNGLPVTSIDTYAFLNGVNVTSVSIPEGVTNIGFGAFDYCSSLTSITIPNTVTTIGEQAFINCWSLTNVTVPSSVKNIEAGAFFYCSSLVSVTIPNGVTNISESAFAYCESLANIAIPDSVQTIGWNALASCSSLTNISIPGSVTQIAGNAFYDCSNLQAFTVDSLNPSYTDLGGVLFSKDLSLLAACPSGKSGSYAIPNGVKDIGDFAFAVCRNLTNIYLSSTVTNIGFWAFSQCESILTITIPKSVGFIDDLAFQDCPLLWGVFFQGNAPGVSGFGSRAFDHGNLYYLPGTTGWNDFFSFLNLPGILWNPQMQTSDGSFGVRTNRFGFSIIGTPDIPVVVEATTNLTGSSWVSLQTGSLTNGLVYFCDPSWTNLSTRYYRIRSP